MTPVVSDKGYVANVHSTNLEVIAYSNTTETLWVKFKTSGEVYEYLNVDGNDAEGLRTASSHGSFHNSNIKPNYQHRLGSQVEFEVFCETIRIQSTVVPIVNIDWAALSAQADQMVWTRY